MEMLDDDVLNTIAYDESSKETIQMIHTLSMSQNNPMLVGDPGTGKTAVIKAYSKAIEYNLITIIGSQMESYDVLGLPSPVKIEGLKDVTGTAFLSPKWQIETLLNEKTVLFFDEFSNSKSDVQASFLNMFQDRTFPSGQKIPDETIIIGAMNPSNTAVDYNALMPPTTNRMAWISWNPSREAWYNGMVVDWGNPNLDPIEKVWRINIVEFIRENPSFLHKENTGLNPEIYGISGDDYVGLEVFNNAWASRRSWDNLSRALAKTKNENVQYQLMISLVGYPAAIEFKRWLDKKNKISIDEILNDPENMDWDTMMTRVDEVSVVMQALEEMIDKHIDLEKYAKIIRVFEVVAEKGYPVVAMPRIESIFRKTPNKDEHKRVLRRLIDIPDYREALKASRNKKQ